MSVHRRSISDIASATYTILGGMIGSSSSQKDTSEDQKDSSGDSSRDDDVVDIVLPTIKPNVDLSNPNDLKLWFYLCQKDANDLRSEDAMNSISLTELQDQRVSVYKKKSNAADAMSESQSTLSKLQIQITKVKERLTMSTNEHALLDEVKTPRVEGQIRECLNKEQIIADVLYGATDSVFDKMSVAAVHKAICLEEEWNRIKSEGRTHFSRTYIESNLKLLSRGRYGNNPHCKKEYIVSSTVEAGVWLLKHTTRIIFDDDDRETVPQLSARFCKIICFDPSVGFPNPSSSAADATSGPLPLPPPSPSPYEGNANHQKVYAALSGKTKEELQYAFAASYLADPIRGQQALYNGSKASKSSSLTGTKRPWTDESDTDTESVEPSDEAAIDAEIVAYDARLAALKRKKKRAASKKRTKTTSHKVASSTNAVALASPRLKDIPEGSDSSSPDSSTSTTDHHRRGKIPPQEDVVKSDPELDPESDPESDKKLPAV